MEVLQIVGMTLLAGLAMPAGALIACAENFHSQWLESGVRRTIMAFGGGALLSAIALVLVPEGTRQLDIVSVAICFASGGIAFMLLDVILDRFKSPAGQLVAMLSDFIPEALALGAAIAAGSPAGFLLAALMGLQNLPEGFNSFRELVDGRPKTKFRNLKVVLAFGAMALLGPVAGLAGYFFLASYPQLVAGVMLFAAGGILYVVFQDIAPAASCPTRNKSKEIAGQPMQESEASDSKSWGSSLGCVFGFLLGLLGSMLVG